MVSLAKLLANSPIKHRNLTHLMTLVCRQIETIDKILKNSKMNYINENKMN